MFNRKLTGNSLIIVGGAASSRWSRDFSAWIKNCPPCLCFGNWFPVWSGAEGSSRVHVACCKKIHRNFAGGAPPQIAPPLQVEFALLISYTFELDNRASCSLHEAESLADGIAYSQLLSTDLKYWLNTYTTPRPWNRELLYIVSFYG